MSRHSRCGVEAGAVRGLITNRRGPTTEQRSWFRIDNKRTVRNADGANSTDTEVWIYDEIGMWGVSAQDFARELKDVDTDTITLRLNSPGGEVYDGIAIMNALIGHDAHVTVKVDALAASIASVIAMAGDKVVMGAHSEFMIHDASTIGVGNAADLREVADMLDRVSQNIAEVYSERAGGKAEDWRDLMLAETWFSAEDAVKAGLADEVAPPPKKRDGSDPEDDDEEIDDAARKRILSSFDLSGFRYSGRSAAPAPALAKIQSEPDRLPVPPPATESVDPVLPVAAEDDPESAVKKCPACGATLDEDGECPDCDTFDLASAFSESLASATASMPGYSPGLFHEAVRLFTDAPDPVPAPPILPPAPVPVVDQAFPADLVPVVDPEIAGIDPDVFRAAITMVANDAPAPTTQQGGGASATPADPDDSFVVDPAAFYNSLKEAIFK